MAATVINNPDSIHDYRDKIGETIEELKQQLVKTESAIETVSESWRDENFQQFQNNFNEDKEKIRPLCEVLLNYKDNLLYQLEQKLRVYTEETPMHL